MDPRAPCARSRPPTSTMPEASSSEIWTPMHLERLARTYWKYLSRVTLGLIRVEYTDDRAGGRAPAPAVRAAALPARPSTR